MQREVTNVNFSYYDKSQPKKSQPQPVSSGQPSKKTGVQLDRLNIVAKDQSWIQMVSKEKDNARTWQRNWAFLAEYDPKGQRKAGRKLPDRPVMYADHVPSTTSGNYGAYLDLEPSRSIQFFEQKFSCGHRRKPISSDLVCH